MRVILRQIFPLGRFHATPWRASPFDDPYGEWPPSPWRLLRALIARSHQFERECGAGVVAQREALVAAFSSSRFSWRLPEFSWRGPGIRQYQPVDFEFSDPNKGKPGMKAYGSTLVQDGFWVIDPADPVIWHLDDGEWAPSTLELLDHCLARILYFGRAESLTTIRRVSAGNEEAGEPPLAPNCVPEEHRCAGAVPLLALAAGASLKAIVATTDELRRQNQVVPPGARWLFAARPPRPAPRPAPRQSVSPPATNCVQFALGGRVLPPLKDAVRLTERFRGRVLRAWLARTTGETGAAWQRAPEQLRQQASGLTGKDASGRPLLDHSQAVFFLHFEGSRPQRLCVWRREAFDEEELSAILSAAGRPLPLDFSGDPWELTLIPLAAEAPLPPTLSPELHARWSSMTPFVPPRHRFGRRGKEHSEESVEAQFRRELRQRGLPHADIVAEVSAQEWVKVHLPQHERRGGLAPEKMGFRLEVRFPNPVRGPLFLGASCHFGLGAFVPADAAP